MGLSGRRGRERREPRGVSDSKTGGTLSKRKAALGVAEDGKVAERKWGTQIGSFSKRHNSNRSSTGLKEALWGVQENNDLEEEGKRNEWTQARKLKFVPTR